jgi:eukaryotic-like serine/threonine-protein kinase
MNEESLFGEALARPLEERAAFLDAACAGKPQLRAAVEALLAAHERSGNLLDKPPQPIVTGEYTPSPAAAPQVATADYQPEVGPGVVIAGRYTLVEKIGEGGMGEVWVAKQTEPVKRRVALKLIKAGMDSKAVLQRFEQERQALAMMDHPNIARVLDGGMTADRRPFFVMELVNGLALTKFCDEAKLTPKDRLELFVPICQAVQHAHQKGIVHRDLKPSNILVTIYDGKSVPKIIDFGVAKATGGKLIDESLSTNFGAVVGTLEYMAPEQAGLSAVDIDTRADIYSLGVILYELLTGLKPHDSQRLRKAALTEMVRIIQEEEPSKPSTRLSTDESLPSLAALRQTEPKKLMALLRGELDWVVMKCLEKQRNRRYETANALARDLQRYLADEPVEARPASFGYRAGKFLRRNKGPMLAASAFAGLVVLGIIGLIVAIVAVNAEQQHTADALAQVTAEQVKTKSALDAESKARQAEKQARQKALEALRMMTDEVVENRMARATQLGEEDKEFLRKIIKHFESFATITGDAAESRAIRAVGYFRVGVMRYQLGELKEAESAYIDALALYKQLAADFPTRPEFRQQLAMSSYNLGLLFQNTGRLKEAESSYTDALAIYKPLVAGFPARPEFRQELAMSYNSLGGLFHNTGRPKEAESALTDALAVRKQLAADFPAQPEFRQQLASGHNNLGLLLHNTGRLKEAESAYTDALAIYKQLAADFPVRFEFRQELASSHNNLGTLFSDTGRLKEAESAYTDALVLRKQLAADFPNRPELRKELASSHYNMGNLLSDTGRLKEAESAYADALAIFKQLAADFPTQPEFRQQLAASNFNLGLVLQNIGRLNDAESAYVTALAIRKQLATSFLARPDFRQDLASSHGTLGLLLRATGRLKEAESAFADALAIYKQLAADFPTRPEFREQLARSHNNLGLLLCDTGRLMEAESAYAAALALFKQLAAAFPNQPDARNEAAGTLVNLAMLCNHRRDFRKAKAYLEEALPHHQAALLANPRNPNYRQFYRNHLMALTRTHAGLRDQSAALATAQKLRDVSYAPLADAYDAACALAQCVPIVEKDDKLDASKRRAETEFYAGEAMKMLRDAVGKGYEDVAHMKKDTDLAPLRQREDFQKLVAELERKKPEKQP